MTINDALAIIDGIDERIAVSIIDRMRTMPRERARRFQAVADMLGGWQIVTTGETRTEALMDLAKLIKDNNLAEVEP